MNINKKLLLRLSCVFIIISFTVTAFALNSMVDEENITVSDTENEIGITVPYTPAPGVEQVTLLAVRGGEDPPETIEESDIVYIDQQSAELSSFSFTVDKDKFDGENRYIHIKLGGTSVETPDLVTMEIYSGHSISGTVSTAADYYDFEDADINNELNSAWKTTVELRPSFLSDTVIATADVDPETKAFELTDIENGTYVLEIKRKGYLARNVSVTVSDGDVELQDKPLHPGDLDGNYFIDGSDVGLLFSKTGNSYGDPGYSFECDIYADGYIDGSDVGLLFTYTGLDYSSYNEDVNFEE
jgi:hypothetical protein